MTSSLPRTRSYHLSYVGITLERETGLEPATNSLEGCDSTTELLPPSRLAVMKTGGEGRIRTSEATWATDLQSVAFDRSATSPTSAHRRPPGAFAKFSGAGEGI